MTNDPRNRTTPYRKLRPDVTDSFQPGYRLMDQEIDRPENSPRGRTLMEIVMDMASIALILAPFLILLFIVVIFRLGG